MAGFSAYIKLARPDHWFKNILMLPGVLLALLFIRPDLQPFLRNLICGVLSACFIASANYVINEWVDADYDKFHPIKKNRPAVLKQISLPGVCIEYLLLLGAGLAAARAVSWPFLFTAVFFGFMGFAYNVRPLRMKDYPVIDVLSESINNPIRLLLGWFVVTDVYVPPASIILSYWMGGAYLMAVKRYSELRFMESHEDLIKYRKSFARYTPDKLLMLSFFFALNCAFFLGIFLIKYRIELLLSFPFLSILFVWYLKLGMRRDSPAQYPEKLYREGFFITYLSCLFVLLVMLFLWEVPSMRWFLRDSLIKIPWQSSP